MSSSTLPLVSVAIPLFKSRRFLDCIISNLEAIDYPNIEVIISDRHCADDAIELLADRFKADSRLRLLKGSDQLNWVEHYNLLLQLASGQYFLWMPHDDSYPSDYISQLVLCLENHPDAMLAYGRLRRVDLDGHPVSGSTRSDIPVALGEQWSLRAALRLLIFWNIGVPFRGVFRRDVVIQSGLLIRPTYETVAADKYWVFGLALKGCLRLVPSCHCTKRMYPTSTSAQWGPRRTRHVIDGGLVLCSYIKDFASNRREVCYAVAMVFLWVSLRLIGLCTQNWRWLSEHSRRSLLKFLEGTLFTAFHKKRKLSQFEK